MLLTVVINFLINPNQSSYVVRDIYIEVYNFWVLNSTNMFDIYIYLFNLSMNSLNYVHFDLLVAHPSTAFPLLLVQLCS